MRATVMLGAGVALITAGASLAQAPGAPYPVPGPDVRHPPLPPAPQVRPPAAGDRWGSRVGGRWWGGANAPGGWAAYRPPARGNRLPGYWVAPRFRITDWQRYRLPQPWAGYDWVRYYDDAVLIDRGGQVFDWRDGIDWDGAGEAGPLPPPPAPGFDNLPPPVVTQAPPPPRIDRHRRDVIVRADGPGLYPPPPPPPPPGAQHWTSADGRTTVTTTTTTGGGYAYAPPPVIVAPPAYAYGYGYGYGAAYGGATTVTVQTAPVVTTTTTTEIVEDRVTYSRPVVRRVVYRRAYRAPVRYRPRPRPRPACVCGS